MYATILVAVDVGHGDLGAELLHRAADLLDEGGTVQLVYVIEDIPAYVMAELPADTIEKRREEAREHLAAIATAAGVEARIDLRSGHAANGILDAARDVGADLIMIASHRPDFRDYFIGSTAARVVRHAPCSVLISR